MDCESRGASRSKTAVVGAAMIADRERPQLTLGGIVGIGAGDFGFNLYWQAASLYLLYFYTDVLNIPAAIAGAVYMAALIWDAVLDPLVGLAADRTNSRFGRYRPYLLFGGIPLALCFVAIFLTPKYSAPGCIPILIGSQLLFRTAYAAISVPYTALSARVTTDHKVRTNLSAVRMIFATAGALVVSLLTLPFAARLGTAGDPATGWIAIAIFSGIIATACFLVVTFSTRKLDVREARVPIRIGFVDKLKASRGNVPMFLVVGAIAASSISSTIFQKGLVYELKYAMGRPDIIGPSLGGMALVAAISIPLWAFMARRFGNRVAWLWGFVPSVTGLILWYLSNDQNVAQILASLGLMAVGTGAGIVCFWSAVPDTVEYGEWKSGVRTESFVFGLVVLAQKAALGIGAGLLGILLSRLGYVAGATQSVHMLQTLKSIMFGASLCGSAVVAFLIWFYPISPARHAELLADIIARKVQILE
jgi:GPH family glycoside/pentoside/hexuronide:cation symporter